MEPVRRQIYERAIGDQVERKLKAKLGHAIQLWKGSVTEPKSPIVAPGGPLHRTPPSRLGPSTNASSRYTPRTPARQYSTNASSEPVLEDAFPTSSNELHMRHDPGPDQPRKDSMDIREQLQLWQQQQDATAKSNLSPVTNGGNNAGLLARYITSAPGDDLVAEPAQIESQSYDLDPPFCNDDEVMETNEGRPLILPGDLVEMRNGRHTVLAIYVRTFARQAQFYSIQGKWIHKLVRHLYFTVPRFVNIAEVAKILQFLPQEEIAQKDLDQSHQLGAGVPRSAGATMVEKMKDFVHASNKVYRAHADRIDHAFDLVADEKQLQPKTLSEIASTILQIPDPSKITYPALWAVHRALIQVEIGFRVDHRDHWQTGMFEILSKKEVHLVMTVRQWLREYQERLISQVTDRSSEKPKPTDDTDGATVIANFVSKTRRIVQQSRKFRPLTASGYISTSSIQLEAKQRSYFSLKDVATMDKAVGHFHHRETCIIRFLELWAARRYFRSASTLSAMGPMLLRAVGMYEGFELDESMGYTFLQEIGVLAPWENRVAFNTRLALPQYNFDDVSEGLLAKAEMSLTDWEPKDSMEHLRKDWKDLEVFCVDSARAQEIDDGFSLEKIEGDETHFWVHVHVANPTAFLTPEDPVSQYAARLVESIYLPDRSYNMLSPAITQRHFSLHKDRPALTFSAKLNLSGEIVATTVTPSIVRNVKFFTPEYLVQQLAPDDAESSPVSILTVGHSPPPNVFYGKKNLSLTLDDSQRKTLHKLLELGAAYHGQLLSKGAIFARFFYPEASVHYMDNSLPFRRVIRRIEGDPTISIQTAEFDPTPGRKILAAEATGMLVPNLMILAGEVAARWTSERGIPMFYRGTQRNPELGSASEYKKNVLDPLIEKHGAPPPVETLRYMNLAGRGYSSPDPVPHQVLGTDAYTKVTSPLRRYGDMLAHWQIEAVLRHEAETGKSLFGKRDHSCLPFSRGQVEKIIPHLSVREATISQAKRASEIHWTLQALYRAHELKEAVLPETFEIYIWGDYLWAGESIAGVTKVLGLQCFLSIPRESALADEIMPGDWWEGKIAEINLYQRKVWMTPIRLIKRTKAKS
ncbi:hypothetical protein MMC30_004146 [Trapelia coarctata]|nr:hypothetical protein [Trapelia coarctata]